MRDNTIRANNLIDPLIHPFPEKLSKTPHNREQLLTPEISHNRGLAQNHTRRTSGTGHNRTGRDLRRVKFVVTFSLSNF